MLGSSKNLTNMFASSQSGNQIVANVDQLETPKRDNKLGKDFKHQTWYSSFLEKPIVEKVQSIFKKKGLNEVEKTYEIIKENALEDMLLQMKSQIGQDDKFLLNEEIGRGTYGVVYRAKRLSDEKEVSHRIFKFLPGIIDGPTCIY